MKIFVEIKAVYGNETIYPACATSSFFAALAGTKTLTREKLRLVIENGYRVEVRQTGGTIVDIRA